MFKNTRDRRNGDREINRSRTVNVFEKHKKKQKLPSCTHIQGVYRISNIHTRFSTLKRICSTICYEKTSYIDGINRFPPLNTGDLWNNIT